MNHFSKIAGLSTCIYFDVSSFLGSNGMCSVCCVVHAYEYLCVHAHIRKPEQDFGCHFFPLHVIALKPVSRDLEPAGVYRHVQTMLGCLCECYRFELRCSCLQSKHSDPLAHLPSPSVLSFTVDQMLSLVCQLI